MNGLSARLREILEEKGENPLSRFVLEVVGQVRAFLTAEYGRPFPTVQLSLRDGESYRRRLLELGVPEDSIEGSSGMYIGNVFSADIVIDLEGVREFLIIGQVASAIVFLVDVLMEEYTHVLFPKVSDKKMASERIGLVEKFLTDFKFTDEQKKAIAESVSGIPKDGIFVSVRPLSSKGGRSPSLVDAPFNEASSAFLGGRFPSIPNHGNWSINAPTLGFEHTIRRPNLGRYLQFLDFQAEAPE